MLAIAAASTSRAGSIFDDDWVSPKRVQPPATAAETQTPTPTLPSTQVAQTRPSANVPPVEHAPALPLAPPAQPSRLAIPDKAALAKSRGLLKEVYAEQLKDHSVPGAETREGCSMRN